MKLLYEKYHSKRKLQKRIINRKNFTYANIIPLIDKFTNQSDAVLDMGSGVGTLGFYLAKRTRKVTGVEISSKAVKLARKNAEKFKLNNIQFNEGSGVNNLLANQKFNFVLCSEVLEHVEDDNKLLTDLHDALLPKGKLLVSVPSVNAPLYKLGLLRKFDAEVGHLRRYSIVELSKKIQSVGFKIIEVHRTEGVLRNLLFTSDTLGNLIKFLRWPIWLLISGIDKLMIPLFGESQIIIISSKK